MRNCMFAVVLVACAAVSAFAGPHVITFGKPLPVKLFIGPDNSKSVDMTIRSLYVDGQIKEFTTGDPHDVTDRLFVVRRAYRVNDWLPEDEGTNHKWKWQRGGWMQVDRETGRVSQIVLPLFDPFYSVASWYRDYAAYCGMNEDMTRVYAVVMQLGNKKPLLRRELGAANPGDTPDSICAAPDWQRNPARVSFALLPAGQKVTFAIRANGADVATQADNGEQK